MKNAKNAQKLFVIAVLAAALALCLSGCVAKTTYTYKNGDKYTAGDREITERIDSIDIDYMAGDVTLVSGNTDKVVVKETANKEIGDELKVHTWVNGGTLYVRYCASAKGLNLNNLEKSLEITVPADLDLTNVVVDVDAGDVTVDCASRNYDIDVDAGDATLIQHGSSEGISVDVDAGSVEARIENAARTDIDVDAGDVTVYLPENADVTAEVDVDAGDFDYDIPFRKSGDKYICGSGADKLNIDVDAGSVAIRKYL